MDEYTLLHGDCLTEMAGMDAGSVDAVVTDPPYGLEFMGKEWDRLGGADAPGYKERPRMTPDHMGKGFKALPNYYATGIKAQLWHQGWATEALRVLKPSHYLLAFGGTRTWHRLACAIEDAGFEIRDTLMWLYGSGFPKGTACLKPAWEPIILARKPGPKRALGIEECRIPTDERMSYSSSTALGVTRFGTGTTEQSPSGRWPANLVLDEEAGAMLDEQTGESKPKSGRTGKRGGCEFGLYDDAKSAATIGTWPADAGGGASRFFYCAKASRSERNAGCEGMPEHNLAGSNKWTDMGQTNGSGKLANGDGTVTPQSNHHPTVKPLALMRWLVKLVAQPGDVVLDPFMGSGTTGVACVEEGRNFIGIEREQDYVEIARRRIEAASAQERLPV